MPKREGKKMNKTINVDETVKEMFVLAMIHESWEQKMTMTESEFLRFLLESSYPTKVFKKVKK